jgi:toxin FitB
MNVVDSSGWIEYATDGGNADFFEGPLSDRDNLLVPTICMYEVFKQVLREFGEERALEVIGQMSLGEVVELDRQIAVNAAQISTELKLAMADSIILATARANNATLWTQDEHFKDLDGVKYIGKR